MDHILHHISWYPKEFETWPLYNRSLILRNKIGIRRPLFSFSEDFFFKYSSNFSAIRIFFSGSGAPVLPWISKPCFKVQFFGAFFHGLALPQCISTWPYNSNVCFIKVVIHCYVIMLYMLKGVYNLYYGLTLFGSLLVFPHFLRITNLRLIKLFSHFS